MKFFCTAFMLGLTALGLANADVSHLTRHQQAGHNSFVANDGRVVKQSFNSNGGASFSASSQSFNGNNHNSKRYWWMNSDAETLPSQHNTRTLHNNHAASGCNKCAAASSTLHLKRHNTPILQQQQQNFPNIKNHINGKYITRRPINNPNQIAGSPREVNSYFAPPLQQNLNPFQSSRITSPCTDSNSACVAPKFCFNGIIDQSVESKASRSTVSDILLNEIYRPHARVL